MEGKWKEEVLENVFLVNRSVGILIVFVVFENVHVIVDVHVVIFEVFYVFVDVFIIDVFVDIFIIVVFVVDFIYFHVAFDVPVVAVVGKYVFVVVFNL